MPNPLMALAVGGSAVGGIAQASAASSAARTQMTAADRAAAEKKAAAVKAGDLYTAGLGDQLAGLASARDAQLAEVDRGTRGQISTIDNFLARQSGLMDPYVQSGGAATGALNYELGIGAKPSDYAGFQATPGYEFARTEGMRGIEGSAAANGGLFSGSTLKDLNSFGTGLAQQDYGNFMNRLSQRSGAGQSAAGVLAGFTGAAGAQRLGVQSNANANNLNALANYGNAAFGARNAATTGQANAALGVGNALAEGYINAGNASAAGTIGVGNAISGGINNAIGLGAYGYQQGWWGQG